MPTSFANTRGSAVASQIRQPNNPSGNEPISNVQNSLDPFTQIQFGTQRQNLNTGAISQFADLNFAQGLQGLRRERSISNVTRNFNRSRTALTDALARRGLLRSGVRTTQTNELTDDFNRQVGGIRFEGEVTDAGFDQQRRDIERRLVEALGGIDLDEQLLRAQLAAQLQGVQTNA